MLLGWELLCGGGMGESLLASTNPGEEKRSYAFILEEELVKPSIFTTYLLCKDAETIKMTGNYVET